MTYFLLSWMCSTLYNSCDWVCNEGSCFAVMCTPGEYQGDCGYRAIFLEDGQTVSEFIASNTDKIGESGRPAYLVTPDAPIQAITAKPMYHEETRTTESIEKIFDGYDIKIEQAK